jgi:hypothetical protein
MEKSTTWGGGRGATRGIHASPEKNEIWVSHIGQKLIYHTTIVISFYNLLYSTFTHYCTIKMDAIIIASVTSYMPTVQITFFLLVRIFLPNFFFYLNFYNNVFFSFLVNIF